MRAAVLWERGASLEVRDDVRLRDPRPDQVRVRLAASGVCHSDVSVRSGAITQPVPCVLGHEGAGTVVELGPGVTELELGDRVILTATPACRFCTPCLRGQPYLCARSVPLFKDAAAAAVPGGKNAAAAAPGPFEVAGAGVYGHIGTFAEELIVPLHSVVRIRADVPLDVAALLGCCVITGVGASIHAARVTPGSSVVVFGCGGIGTAAIQGARIAGAAEIVGVDPLPAKCEWARQFGATHAVSPDQLDELRHELTGGEGFDYALECVGGAAVIRQAFDAVRRGGTIVTVGVGRTDDVLELSAFELFFAEKNLRGSMYGSSNARVDFERLLRLWRAGRLDLEGMITRRLPLERIGEAFEALEAGEVVRSIIEY